MPSVASLVLEQYGQLLGDVDADVEVLVGPEERRYPMHKIILKARCAYFRALFESGMRDSCDLQIKLPTACPRAWELLMPFIYSGTFRELPTTEEDLRGVDQLADFLQLGEDICTYFHRDFNLKRFLKRHWEGKVVEGSRASLEWLESVTKTSMLREETGFMLISMAKRHWKAVRILCAANWCGLTHVKARCLEEFERLFRRGIEVSSDSDSDSGNTSDHLSAVERLDKEFDMGLWQLEGPIVDVYITSANEALAAVSRGIAATLTIQTLDDGSSRQLGLLINRMGNICDDVAELNENRRKHVACEVGPENRQEKPVSTSPRVAAVAGVAAGGDDRETESQFLDAEEA
eukprot:TRINITY_DN18728_c1_g1_i1.p1 TRINITY_DN18728_c1_g1~~TRINITY_DN18728_c1_g1_i1.p1  ORF type:complete len:348 (+),score=52.29 TRINITY_DN18728_c1_g1_i1:182-1225(+)